MDRWRDARPEEMWITLGSEEIRSNGRKIDVTAATDVTFALKVVLKEPRKSASSVVFCKIAIPALFTNT